MPINVSDTSSNRDEKIANAAKVLGRSKDRKKVFLAIYNGKKKIKVVSDIQELSGIRNRIRVLQEAKKLAAEDIIEQLDERRDNETAYRKIDFYTHNKNRILALAEDKKRLEDFPTKSRPNVRISIVKVPHNVNKACQITIDDIDSFSKVRKMRLYRTQLTPLYENEFKETVKLILDERGEFKDWGGEKNDLYTTELRFKGKRLSTAFGFKGRGTRGKLTPAKMGKNGDQIQRLFQSRADMFIVQYWGQIAQSVIEQMDFFAIAKSVTENRPIYYCIIDGKDTQRICAAYQKRSG